MVSVRFLSLPFRNLSSSVSFHSPSVFCSVCNRVQMMSSFRNIEPTSPSRLKCHSEHEADSPVHIMSRIKGLSSAIRILSNEFGCKANVKEINIPVGTDVLHPSCRKELEVATIAVIDPKILAYNYKDMPQLKWAHCTWAGVEPLFEIMNEKPQFILTRHGEADFSEQMAEYVLAHILILEKNLKKFWAAQTEKSWSKMKNCIDDTVQIRPIKDLTLGILGVGNMGHAIASFFKPHGTKVIGLGKTARKASEFGPFYKIETSLAEVLASSDYIINTLPSTPETVGLLNGDVLKSCTKMPTFINVGRGNIINENTILKALENKWLRHAVLDVFEEEPVPSDSLLWNSINQITITPHCAAISQPTNIAKDFISSFLSYQQNSPLKNIVDWEKGY